MDTRLEQIIQDIENGESERCAYTLEQLRLQLGGNKSVYDMTAPAALVYVLTLFLSRTP